MDSNAAEFASSNQSPPPSKQNPRAPAPTEKNDKSVSRITTPKLTSTEGRGVRKKSSLKSTEARSLPEADSRVQESTTPSTHQRFRSVHAVHPTTSAGKQVGVEHPEQRTEQSPGSSAVHQEHHASSIKSFAVPPQPQTASPAAPTTEGSALVVEDDSTAGAGGEAGLKPQQQQQQLTGPPPAAAKQRARSPRLFGASQSPAAKGGGAGIAGPSETSGALSAASMLPKRDGGSLLRLFQSECFDAYFHMYYLFTRKERGVHDYLVNLLYRRPDEEIHYYLPQLCQLAILRFSSSSLPRFLLDKAAKSMHLALKASWLFQASVDDKILGLIDPASKMTQEVEMAVVNSKPFPSRDVPESLHASGISGDLVTGSQSARTKIPDLFQRRRIIRLLFKQGNRSRYASAHLATAILESSSTSVATPTTSGTAAVSRRRLLHRDQAGVEVQGQTDELAAEGPPPLEDERGQSAAPAAAGGGGTTDGGSDVQEPQITSSGMMPPPSSTRRDDPVRTHQRARSEEHIKGPFQEAESGPPPSVGPLEDAGEGVVGQSEAAADRTSLLSPAGLLDAVEGNKHLAVSTAPGSGSGPVNTPLILFPPSSDPRPLKPREQIETGLVASGAVAAMRKATTSSSRTGVPPQQEKGRIAPGFVSQTSAIQAEGSKLKLPSVYGKLHSPFSYTSFSRESHSFLLDNGEMQQFIIKQRRCDYFNLVNTFITMAIEVSDKLTQEPDKHLRVVLMRTFYKILNEWMLCRRCIVAASEGIFAMTGLAIPFSHFGPEPEQQHQPPKPVSSAAGSSESMVAVGPNPVVVCLGGNGNEEKKTAGGSSSKPVESSFYYHQLNSAQSSSSTFQSVQIVRVAWDECKVFSSRKRAPYLLVCEMADLDEDLRELPLLNTMKDVKQYTQQRRHHVLSMMRSQQSSSSTEMMMNLPAGAAGGTTSGGPGKFREVGWNDLYVYDSILGELKEKGLLHPSFLGRPLTPYELSKISNPETRDRQCPRCSPTPAFEQSMLLEGNNNVGAAKEADVAAVAAAIALDIVESVTSEDNTTTRTNTAAATTDASRFPFACPHCNGTKVFYVAITEEAPLEILRRSLGVTKPQDRQSRAVQSPSRQNSKAIGSTSSTSPSLTTNSNSIWATIPAFIAPSRPLPVPPPIHGAGTLAAAAGVVKTGGSVTPSLQPPAGAAQPIVKSLPPSPAGIIAKLSANEPSHQATLLETEPMDPPPPGAPTPVSSSSTNSSASVPDEFATAADIGDPSVSAEPLSGALVEKRKAVKLLPSTTSTEKTSFNIASIFSATSNTAIDPGTPKPEPLSESQATQTSGTGRRSRAVTASKTRSQSKPSPRTVNGDTAGMAKKTAVTNASTTSLMATVASAVSTAMLRPSLLGASSSVPKSSISTGSLESDGVSIDKSIVSDTSKGLSNELSSSSNTGVPGGLTGDGSGSGGVSSQPGASQPHASSSSGLSGLTSAGGSGGGDQSGGGSHHTLTLPNESISVRAQRLRRVIWGETWAEKRDRIRARSPYGRLKSWRLGGVLVKGGDDVRQELLAWQLIRQFKAIFDEARLGLYLRPYEILVTGCHSGIMEFVPDTMSIDAIKKKFNTDSIAKVFDASFGDDLLKAKRNFVESHAAYSLVGYFLNVKDRHNGNLLLTVDGHIVHIDHGFMFASSPGYMNFETSPFKLSAELMGIMDGDQSELFEYFKQLIVKGFLEARKHADRIFLVVEMMLSASKMPCFAGAPEGTFQALKDRFMLSGITEDACISRILDLIDSSVNNWRTAQYDNFQRLSNGIF